MRYSYRVDEKSNYQYLIVNTKTFVDELVKKNRNKQKKKFLPEKKVNGRKLTTAAVASRRSAALKKSKFFGVDIALGKAGRFLKSVGIM